MGEQIKRTINPSGFVHYTNEKELCKQLENNFFPGFFDPGWKPIINVTKEIWLSPDDRIDYYGLKNGIPTYFEVKNWFVKHKEITKILTYRKLIDYSDNLCVICGGIQSDRLRTLDLSNIKTILVRDIDELNPGMVVYWM